MSEHIIEINNISKSYGAKRILNGLSFGIPKGSVFGLLGKNGAGKTTLIKCVLGLLKAQSGSIKTLGDSPSHFKVTTKEKLGYVPQMDRMYPWLKVRDVISYTASFYTHWNSDLVNRLLSEWELNPEDKVGILSEGQAQKLSIILALGHEPNLLIFDEPVASLDPYARRQFLKTILDLVADRECTVFFSTHITSDIERVADSVAILNKGEISFYGSLDDLKDEVKKLKIISKETIPENIKFDGLIEYETADKEAILTVRGFNETMQKEIEQQFNAKIERHDLNLEDIFLELTK